MSSFSLDRHMFCIKCRGSDCDQDTRCDECLSWTKEEMDGYIKLRKSLSSKNKNSLKTSSSPPRSTAPVVDLDSRFAAQLDTVNKSMDDKLSAMSSALLSQFTVMLDQFKLGITNSSVSGNPGVPGYSVSQTEPPSLRHPVSTEIQRLRFQDGGEDPVPHGLGVAQGAGIPLARPQLGKDAAPFRDPPAEGNENAQRPSDPSGPKVTFAQPLVSEAPQNPEEDDDDDDRDSVAEPPVLDKTLSGLISFIYDEFAHSRPLTNASAPPRCEFEEYFAISDPPTSSRQNLRVYPRVSEIIDSSSEKASRLACESKPLHKVVPLRRKIFFVDDQDFCTARFVNPDFFRISNSKTILKSHLSSACLSDLERIERATRTVIAGYSQCFWLLSSLLAQLKEDGFRPSDPALFDENISALSSALASQTTVASGLSDFITSKRRESYLAHASCPIAESQKRELLVAPGTGSLLFQ